MGGGKLGILVAAIAAGGGTAVEVVTKTKLVLLNVPLSMLYVAIAGTMIGVFLLPSKEAARVNLTEPATRQQRILYTLFSVALVGAAVLCYAFVSAWVVQIAEGIIRTVFTRSLDESVILPATGLIGVGIRPWLPSLLKAVERRADRVIGGSP